MPKPTIYTVFANSRDNYLPNLSEEAMQIADTFQPLAFNDKIYYVKDEIFSVDRMVQSFAKYGSRFDLFYFSGHSKDGCLQLGDEFKTEPGQMSGVITSCLTNIKLIFFNACETFELTQEIAQKRKKNGEDLVMIGCRGEINTFFGEKFATLLLKQIGQLGTIRDAYDQAKNLVSVIGKGKVSFKEFDNENDVLNAGTDFDIGYIELKGSVAPPPLAPAPPPSGAARPARRAAAPAAPAAAGASPSPELASDETDEGDSIIGKDKLTRDALTTNYLKSVLQTLTSTDSMQQDKVDILNKALKAAKQVAQGEKKKQDAMDIFNQAANAVPGISSGNAFNSLINAEKHLNDPSVKSYIKPKESPITDLVNIVKNIKI